MDDFKPTANKDGLDDFREKFRDLLKMQMEALIFRSKIPAFENGEVDTLFEKIEQAQNEISKEYRIENVKTAPHESSQNSMSLLSKRVDMLEKKFDLIIEQLKRLESEIIKTNQKK